jgi:putative glutathione S-transferase
MKSRSANPPYAPDTDARGRFVRSESRFRNWITADGAPGPSGDGGFPAAADRYHLYVALNCPWAHRTLIFRKIKRLETLIGVSVVLPWRGPQGWAFGEYPGSTPDEVNGFRTLREAYLAADPGYDGRVTVPVLWDKRERTIVSNESSEIIRMFNSAFAAFTDDGVDYYPERLRPQIDAINALVYANVNNGVYRAGFARSQEAYEEAFDDLFGTLDELEARLGRQSYLAGGRVTEADWRLFPTLVRFDAAYYGAFKCNRNRLVDFPNLWSYTRALYQWPGVAETVNLDHIKQGYWHIESVNPSGIVPLGPRLDFTAPHDRGA